MLFENVVIAGLAHVDAPERVTSAALGDRLAPLVARWKLPADLLESMTGIVARRFWEPGTAIADAAAEAGRRALAAAGREPSEIGLVISTSVSRDFVEPSTASAVHRALGLPADAMNFDVGNACLAFLDAIVNASLTIERGGVKHCLIVCAESSRAIVDATIDRLLASPPETTSFFRQFATLTLGSGAVAMVLSHASEARGAALRGGVFLADTRHNHLCRGRADEMQTDSSALLVAGLDLAARTWEKASKTLGWQGDSLDAYCLHQVSRAHTEKLAAKLGLAPEKVPALYTEHGNMGPASWPTVLSKAIEAGRIGPGQRVGVLGIGSGLNCAMFEIDWK